MNRKKMSIAQRLWADKYLYLMLLPLIVWIAVFCYVPMGGILMAFKDYSAKLGIWGSEWVGLKHFRRIFVTPAATKAIINTVEISLSRLVWQFPFPIILAILITEMPGKKLKKIYQTIFTFPHFLSWVVVGVIVSNFMSNNGAINSILSDLGFEKVNFLANVKLFRPLLYVSENWKEMGWSAIIYMAAIAGIDPTLYDAAKVDGASRMQQIWHITLIGIRSTIAILFILAVGGLMNAGFDQIFNLRNGVVKETVQILDAYVYDITFDAMPDYGFSTAVGLFRSMINLALLLLANRVVKMLTGEKMFG